MKVLVPISGGKDSQACLKLAVAKYGTSDVLGLFCDTQFEHPKTYAHVEKLKSLYGVTIQVVTGGSVLEKSLKYKRFPGGGARHCTDELKIKETKKFCIQLAKNIGGFEVWYGMRLNESHERKKRYIGKISEDLYEPHEIMPSKYPQYLGKMGVKFRLPILDWTTLDVLEYLEGEQNPLYEVFDRVGCFPCLAAGDRTKELAFNYDEFGQQQYIKVMEVSEKIGKSVWTSKGMKFKYESGQGCLICQI